MNKQELVAAVAAKTGLNKAKTQEVIDEAVAQIVQSMVNDDPLTLVGFGSFRVVKREARTVRNPSTGKSLEVPAKKVPKFIPGKCLKEAVNGKK